MAWRCRTDGRNTSPSWARPTSPQGWRSGKATGGALIDVDSNETIARGFAMPHSPRVHDGHVWLLHSGVGRLTRIDLADRRRDDVLLLPGYARGLAFAGPFAFIGLSKVRETSAFGGVPIAERPEGAQVRCSRRRPADRSPRRPPRIRLGDRRDLRRPGAARCPISDVVRAVPYPGWRSPDLDRSGPQALMASGRR